LIGARRAALIGLVKSFLLSWLKKSHRGMSLDEFERQMAGPWLVWEAGPWRPPSSKRLETLASGPNTRLLASGESLAILLEARKGGTEVTLGRGSTNDIVVDDATLSRVHLVFAKDAFERWTVRDPGSRNGTKVDGVPAGKAARPVTPGALIEAGAVRLSFYDGAGLYLRLRAG
jgi:FHA domain-containing protein